MEKMLETPPRTALPSENTLLDHKTPLQTQINDQGSPVSADSRKSTGTPDHLKVPKAFRYPERYTSPTDLMMSPVSKGILARSRKTAALLPPTKNLYKIGDSKVQEAGL
ncbi:hypothetical protein RJ639_036802 [Escallonia herrerae]|uniref:Uncharacterized protein n=1 Tax=Escallonia herrerae TaxID=1293975 RepID=A0AA89BA06_9ASTE|nr:hypothetical protein RJ639_036802 [Escallonia herrerae]